MRLEKLYFEDKTLGLIVDNVEFSNKTLLVGASGAGKTRILYCLQKLKEIALGGSPHSMKWTLHFSYEGKNCVWSGESRSNKKIIDISDLIPFEEDKNSGEFTHESITVNSKLITQRDKDGKVSYESKKNIRLSTNESLIYLLKEEKNLKEIGQEFRKIFFSELTNDSLMRYFWNLPDEEDIENLKLATDEKSFIERTDINAFSKFFISKTHFKNIFDTIKQKFCEIFLTVEDISFSEYKNEGLPRFFRENIPIFSIKEKGVDFWIPFTRMSSGMFRTLLHIVEGHLSPSGSVIIIDEFENSLGINCIHDVTTDILHSNNVQHILTSHHPYIINNIPVDLWKIIRREGSHIKSFTSQDLNIGISRHEAFLQLINSEIINR